MTSALILSLSLIQSNSFQVGARDEFGGWSSNITWNVRMSYATPPSGGVYVVEFNYQPLGATPSVSYSTNNGVLVVTTNGYYGSRWTELNTSTFVSFPPYQNYSGFYTNLPNGSGMPLTNTILFPTPFWDKSFYRLKKVY